MRAAILAFRHNGRGTFRCPGGGGCRVRGLFFRPASARDSPLAHLHPVHVIHAHSALPCGHAALLLSRELKIPFVVTVHGLDAFSTRQVQGHAGKWCARISQTVYRSACSVICVSEKVRDQVTEGAGTRVNTVVLYNGVDPQIFSPGADGPDAPVVLSVGNLIPVKGQELLLRAFAAIHNRFPTSSLEIIGDGPERARLQQKAKERGLAGKIHFRGRQSRAQVADAMRRATVFALPSRYEGLGCVYLEAMASGKPVIACRGQGIEEVIKTGMNGCLIAADDCRDWKISLAQLLTQAELREKIGAAARQTVTCRDIRCRRQAARLFPHIPGERGMRRRLVIITEIIAPYRIPVFNALAREEGIDLHVIFLAESDPGLRTGWSTRTR